MIANLELFPAPDVGGFSNFQHCGRCNEVYDENKGAMFLLEKNGDDKSICLNCEELIKLDKDFFFDGEYYLPYVFDWQQQERQ